jgi:predicted MPP superfamily phosphohydrolase
MRRIAHLSDLHFGRTDEKILAVLTRRMQELSPDLIVISGNLTQRARSR